MAIITMMSAGEIAEKFNKARWTLNDVRWSGGIKTRSGVRFYMFGRFFEARECVGLLEVVELDSTVVQKQSV